MDENLNKLTLERILDFKENIRGNFIILGDYDFEKVIFENEYSPFRNFIQSVKPDIKLKLTITVEVLG